MNVLAFRARDVRTFSFYRREASRLRRKRSRERELGRGPRASFGSTSYLLALDVFHFSRRYIERKQGPYQHDKLGGNFLVDVRNWPHITDSHTDRSRLAWLNLVPSIPSRPMVWPMRGRHATHIDNVARLQKRPLLQSISTVRGLP